MPSSVTITSAEILARDAIVIYFSSLVYNDSILRNTDTYVFSPSLSVAEVIVGDGISISEVTLIVRYIVPGEEYLLTVEGITDSGNLVMDPTVAPLVVGRSTKLDKVLTSAPVLYDTSPTSTIRQILSAIHREDDKIGGSQDEYVGPTQQ